MDADKNPEYLRSVAEAVRLFKADLEQFLELHVINDGVVGRGTIPAVLPRDNADPAEIARRQSRVALSAGRAADAPSLAHLYIVVQGQPHPVDPIAAWLSVTRPKPVLEDSDVLDACDQMIGRLEGKALKAEAEMPPKIGVASMHPLIYGAAARLWRDEHYRQAVAAAAETPITQVKIADKSLRCGRDLSLAGNLLRTLASRGQAPAALARQPC